MSWWPTAGHRRWWLPLLAVLFSACLPINSARSLYNPPPNRLEFLSPGEPLRGRIADMLVLPDESIVLSAYQAGNKTSTSPHNYVAKLTPSLAVEWRANVHNNLELALGHPLLGSSRTGQVFAVHATMSREFSNGQPSGKLSIYTLGRPPVQALDGDTSFALMSPLYTIDYRGALHWSQPKHFVDNSKPGITVLYLAIIVMTVSSSDSTTINQTETNVWRVNISRHEGTNVDWMRTSPLRMNSSSIALTAEPDGQSIVLVERGASIEDSANPGPPAGTHILSVTKYSRTGEILQNGFVGARSNTSIISSAVTSKSGKIFVAESPRWFDCLTFEKTGGSDLIRRTWTSPHKDQVMDAATFNIHGAPSLVSTVGTFLGLGIIDETAIDGQATQKPQPVVAVYNESGPQVYRQVFSAAIPGLKPALTAVKVHPKHIATAVAAGFTESEAGGAVNENPLVTLATFRVEVGTPSAGNIANDTSNNGDPQPLEETPLLQAAGRNRGIALGIGLSLAVVLLIILCVLAWFSRSCFLDVLASRAEKAAIQVENSRAAAPLVLPGDALA